MDEILICTMGLAPGVVTKMTQHLQEKEKIQLSEVCVVYTNNPLIQDLYNYVLREEFKRLGLNRTTLDGKC
jgi:hypothetical protein